MLLTHLISQSLTRSRAEEKQKGSPASPFLFFFGRGVHVSQVD